MTTEAKTITVPGTLNACNVEIIRAKENIGKNLFILGATLKYIRDTQIYKENCETFLEYLAQPEISMARATAFKAIKCYEVFGEKYLPQVTGVDMDKLYLITPMAKKSSTQEFEEWIEKSKLLTRSDLRDVIREAKGKPPKHSLSLREKIDQFIKDDYPSERKERKAFIRKVLEDFELWRNN